MQKKTQILKKGEILRVEKCGDFTYEKYYIWKCRQGTVSVVSTKSLLPNLRLHSDMLLMKAKEFANDFGYEEEVTPSWIKRFKKR